MFLGLSLTTWLILLGVFAIITPIIGKQVAKDALKIKNSLKNKQLAFVLFPLESIAGDKKVYLNAPIQKLNKEDYIFRMMVGGVWTKFLGNIFSLLFILLFTVTASIYYLIKRFFRGIFLTE